MTLYRKADPNADDRLMRRVTAIEFFTPAALRFLRVVGALSAIALGLVIGTYIYRIGYERGMANARPTFAVPALYRWLAVESDRPSEGPPRRAD